MERARAGAGLLQDRPFKGSHLRTDHQESESKTLRKGPTGRAPKNQMVRIPSSDRSKSASTGREDARGGRLCPERARPR